MDKRTRVCNALHNLPVDRPPVGFWFHFNEEQTYGTPCVDAHLEYYNKIDVDFVKIMCDGYFSYPICTKIEKASDWRNLKPLGKEHPFIREQIERAKSVNAGLKEDCCTFYNVFAPFSSIRFGTSDELIMQHIAEDPESVCCALDIIAQDNALLAELLVTEGGCDGIYYCVQGGEKDRFTYEEYRRLITPSDKYVLDHVNQFTKTNILHCCGWAGIPNHLEIWKDYPAMAVNWAIFVEGMNLTEGKRFFDGKAVLGGFDNRKKGVLFQGTHNEITAATKKLISDCSAEAGILIGADCTLPAGVNQQHIQWVVEAVKSMQDKSIDIT